MIDRDAPPPIGVPTWRFIWGIIRYQPSRYALNALAMIGLMLAWQAPGLITRELLNNLTGNMPVRFDLLALLTLLVISAVARVTGIWGLIRTNVPFQFIAQTLLQRNMFAQIYRRPGARALPEEPGKAIARFREDVNELPLFGLWLNDLLGTLVYAAISIVIMASISAQITLFALAPLIVLVALSNVLTKRVERYRLASREATGAVTGFIGETFGAVQAVKIAGAERRVIEHFTRLNATRRSAALKDRLFEEVLGSVFWNAGNLGTGIILLLAAESLRDGAFTVGDFATETPACL